MSRQREDEKKVFLTAKDKKFVKLLSIRPDFEEENVKRVNDSFEINLDQQIFCHKMFVDFFVSYGTKTFKIKKRVFGIFEIKNSL
jgi:hypothetical protein